MSDSERFDKQYTVQTTECGPPVLTAFLDCKFVERCLCSINEQSVTFI